MLKKERRKRRLGKNNRIMVLENGYLKFNKHGRYYTRKKSYNQRKMPTKIPTVSTHNLNLQPNSNE